jgi:hypothetical protein
VQRRRIVGRQPVAHLGAEGLQIGRAEVRHDILPYGLLRRTLAPAASGASGFKRLFETLSGDAPGAPSRGTRYSERGHAGFGCSSFAN